MTEDRDWLPREEQLCKLRPFSLERDKRIGVHINVWKGEDEQGMLVNSILLCNNYATSHKIA